MSPPKSTRFSFEYQLFEKTEIIEIIISEAIVERAHDIGYELDNVVTMANAVMDEFFYHITGTSFWDQLKRD